MARERAGTRGKAERRARIAFAAFLAASLGLAPATPWAAAAADETAPADTGRASGGEGAAAEPSGGSGTGASRGDWYVAEIVDTVYTVGPAEFFALDLPTTVDGALAVHLSGTVTMADRKGDIMVRVFRSADYQGWLKKRDLKQSNPLWSSKRSRNITLNLDLPPGTPITLLLDNGYSLRTAKHVRCQLQMQYDRVGGAPSGETAAGSEGAPAVPAEDPLVTPRSNTEEETPPPPPPPPSEEETK